MTSICRAIPKGASFPMPFRPIKRRSPVDFSSAFARRAAGGPFKPAFGLSGGFSNLVVVEAVKTANPKMSPRGLKEVIKQFRHVVSERQQRDLRRR